MTRDEAIARLTAPGSPFAIVEADVLGTRMNVYEHAPTSMRAVLERTRAHGNRDYLVYDGARWTFEQNFQIACGLAAHFLDRHGLVKGDRVGIAMRNYPEWAMTFWAVQAAGLVAVPLNAWWTGPELDFAIRDSGMRCVVADEERLAAIRPTLRELGVPAIAVRTKGELVGNEKAWDTVIDGFDASATLPDVEIHPDDDATILYTSGTTGQPKGAVATHRNHATNLMNSMFGAALTRELAGLPRSDDPLRPPSTPATTLVTFPFFHIGGVASIYLGGTLGSRLVLMYKWDPNEALELIERERVTSMGAVPTVLRSLLEAAERGTHDLSTLGAVGTGATIVPPSLIDQVENTLAANVSASNGWGLTETTSAVVTISGPEYFAHKDSVGRPVPVAQIQIVSTDTHEPVGPGEVGELWVRGPNIVRGYWNNPQATAQAFVDGWFHTGDLGYADEDGLISIVDRLKDVIIRGGENIYCSEIETVLLSHPAVSDVAAIGVPHEALGEEVAAVVVRTEGHDVTAMELQQHVAAQLATFKVPARIFFWDEPLPRTPTGKLVKRDLREAVLQQTGTE